MGALPFPGMESNNAPLPISGGFGNPTGVNPGGSKLNNTSAPTLLGPTAFPSFPSFGPIQSPAASSRVASATGLPLPTGVNPTAPTANAPVFGSTNLQGLSGGLNTQLTGQPGNPGDKLYKQLVGAYGSGAGASIFDLLTNGTFNPQVAAAFLNAMQPGIQRGESDILGAFGDSGSRFSSGASLGLGDYLSQVNLNEQSTLASLYEQSQNQELSLLQNILPTLHAEHANSGGILGDILGGLEIAGGLAAAPFTGGASLPLVGAGVGTVTGQGGGGGNQQNTTAALQSILKQIQTSQQASSTQTTVGQGQSSGPNGVPTTTTGGGIGSPDFQSISAGGALGGFDPFSSNDGSPDLSALLAMLGG
jgi:hypothetical protein